MLLGTGIAVLLVVLAAASVLAVTTRGGHRAGPGATAGTATSAPAARSAFGAALADLVDTPAAHYTGSIQAPGGAAVPVDATVSNEGRVQAVLTVDGELVQLVTASGRTFVRATPGYWASRVASAATAAEYGAQWVEVPPDTFGVDLGTVLAPGLLARALDPQAGLQRPTVGDPVPVGTVRAWPVRTGGLTVYVGTDRPYRIVRVTSGDTGASPDRTSGHPRDRGRTVPARASTGRFTVDLAGVRGAGVDEFFRTLQARIAELSAALDSQVHFSLRGTVTLAPCGTHGCQANVTLADEVDVTSTYLRAQRPVSATVTIDMTLDGRPVKTCVNAVTMAPNGTVVTTCFAGYTIPPERNPTTHLVRAVARAVARAVIDADLQRMAADLAQEQQRQAPSPTPRPTRSQECADPFLDPNGETHVRRRHFAGGAEHGPGDSTWYAGVDLYELAEAAAGVEAKPQGNGRCVRVVPAGRPIGTDRAGLTTSTYTVVQLPSGKVWTMHPGVPEE